jgi:hypothetical protein
MNEQGLYERYWIISYVISGLVLAFIIYHHRIKRIFKPYEHEMDKSMAFFYSQLKPVIEKHKDDLRLQKQYKRYRFISIAFGILVIFYVGGGVVWNLIT